MKVKMQRKSKRDGGRERRKEWDKWKEERDGFEGEGK